VDLCARTGLNQSPARSADPARQTAGAFSIVSALFDRARTGKGRWLQVAMQDSVMHYSRGMFITQARTGAAAPAEQ